MGMNRDSTTAALPGTIMWERHLDVPPWRLGASRSASAGPVSHAMGGGIEEAKRRGVRLAHPRAQVPGAQHDSPGRLAAEGRASGPCRPRDAQ